MTYCQAFRRCCRKAVSTRHQLGFSPAGRASLRHTHSQGDGFSSCPAASGHHSNRWNQCGRCHGAARRPLYRRQNLRMFCDSSARCEGVFCRWRESICEGGGGGRCDLWMKLTGIGWMVATVALWLVKPYVCVFEEVRTSRSLLPATRVLQIPTLRITS